MRIKSAKTAAVAVLLITAAVILTACMMDVQPPKSGGGEARFVSGGGALYSRAAIDTGTGATLWAADDRIGIYMTGHGAALASASKSNVEYKADTASNNAQSAFSAVTSNQAIYYPDGGTAVDFTAYYPYYANAVTGGNTRPVNVSDQSNPAAIDALWVKADNGGSGYAKSDGTVNLGFNHALSKLSIEVQGDNIEVTNLNGMTVGISMDAAGTFDLADGSVALSGTSSSVSPRCTQTPTATDHGKYEVILLPGDAPVATFTVGGLTYTWTMTGSGNTFPTGFERGKQYSTTVTVNTKGLTVAVTGSGTTWGGSTQSVKAIGRMTVSVSSIDIPFRRVPAGSFLRDDGTNADPAVANAGNGDITVISAPYWMAATETTQELFEAVMGINPSVFTSGADGSEVQARRPVENVSWYDAIAFCNKLSLLDGKTPAYSVNTVLDWGGLAYNLIPASSNADWDAATIVPGATGYRLPTEAEWMWAAMGADTAAPGSSNMSGYLKKFAGNRAGVNDGDVGGYVWHTDNSNTKTHEVGKKQPNELGLYDMSGNVAEWCWDWAAAYLTGELLNPQGASSESSRVRRGGSWRDSAVGVRPAVRDSGTPSDMGYNLGFRLVRP